MIIMKLTDYYLLKSLNHRTYMNWLISDLVVQTTISCIPLHVVKVIQSCEVCIERKLNLMFAELV